MASLQRNLEQLFCPPIDSTLIAAIVNDNPDFDTCFDILSSLAEEANSVLDAEEDIENELCSVDSSSNFRIHSYGEPGDGSITSIDSRSVEDDFDYLSTFTTDYEYESYEHSKGKTKFLKNMFPKLSDDRVNTLLRENDNNVEKAVDVILNETYLENEQLEDDFSCSDSTSTLISNSNADNFSRTNARFEHRKTKRRRKPQRKHDMIILQNTGHRSNSNNSSSSSSSSSSTNSSCWTSSRKPWNKSERESRDGLIDDNKLCQLLDLFPDHNFERLKQTLIDCCGEVQDAIDTLSSEGTLNSSKRQQSKATKQTYHTNEHQNIYLHNAGRHQNCKIYDDDEIVDYEDSYDPDHCQREAFRCYNKRDEMFKKAAQSYQRGQRGVASYQSDEGWKFDAEMKTWKLRAARSLVKKHSEKSKSEYILDLHGCFVTEAIIIVKEWLNDWYPRSDSLKPLKIITGKGNHSPHGVAKLPNAINKFLVNDNWDITKYTGYVLVHGLKNNPRKIY